MIEPRFRRGDVARILGCRIATIANREKSGMYPPARREANNYRTYSIDDVLALQFITTGVIDTRAIADVLYDKGYTNRRDVIHLLDQALQRYRG